MITDLTFAKTITESRSRDCNLIELNPIISKEEFTSILVNTGKHFLHKYDDSNVDPLKEEEHVLKSSKDNEYRQNLLSYSLDDLDKMLIVKSWESKRGRYFVPAFKYHDKVYGPFWVCSSWYEPCLRFSKNPKEFYDDMYLNQERILPTKYVATKWGFDYINKKTGKVEPGKTNYNNYLESLEGESGLRLDVRTPKRVKKGRIDCTQSLAFEKEVNSACNLIKQVVGGNYNIKINEPLLDIPKYLVIIDKQVKALRTKYSHKSKNGDYIEDKKVVKAELIKWANQEKNSKYYNRYLEISKNYKTDRR